jgi:chemotaxis protein methyltransferase CheR
MAITAHEFEMIRTLVRDRAGIVLETGKEYLVESRLQQLVRRENLASVSDVIAGLRGRGGEALAQKVVDVMTTNETTFFRDMVPFEVLRKHVLPRLIEERKAVRRLNIWYAASSTGQEPYSVSMLIHEHFPQLLSWNLTQIATDISPTVLARAREGRYGQVEVNRGLPASCLVKYFSKQGNEWQLKDSVRSMVRFEELNLIKPWATMPEMDIVMIRNVMIYFDVEAKKQILAKVRRILRPDGYMFLGGAETTMNLDDTFVREPYERSGCYRLRTAVAA